MNEKQIVDSVLEQMMQKKTDSEIISDLLSFGIPKEDVGMVIDFIRNGFKAGVSSVVTGGLSDQGISYGENSIFDLAFKRGKASMRFTTPGWVLFRLVWPFLLGAGFIFLVILWWKM